MDRTTELLDRIDGLVATAPFSSGTVARLTGASLRPDADHSDEYTLIYTGGPDVARLFERMELRLPAPGADKRSQLLELNIAPSHCVIVSDVQRRHGEGELRFPTPRQPPDSPVYLVFRKHWGTLSFGFAPDSKRCLREVVIDVHG